MLSITVKALVRWTILSVILIGGFLIVNGMTQAKYDKIAESCKIQLVAEAAEVPVASTTTAEEVVVENPAEVPAEVVDDYQSPINFELLNNRNSGIKYWITISNTRVDYPVVDVEIGNSDYLKKDIDDKSSAHGAIFSWAKTNLFFGHKMHDKTMFGDLDEDDFVAQGHTLTIYSEDGEQDYVPVCNTFANSFDEDGAPVEGNVSLVEAVCDDNYVIFQTCTYGQEKGMRRFIIFEKVN